MKKQAKGIIALSAVLAALLGGGFIYMKGSQEDKLGTRSSEPVLLATEERGQGTIIVSDNGEVGTVEKVVVTNDIGVLNVVMQSPPDENGTGAIYTLEDYKDLDVNTAMVGTLVNNGNGMQAQSLVAEDCTDLGKYGLEKPSAEAVFTYESGNTVKLYIGDATPSNKTVYVMTDGKNDVYTVNLSTVANYSNGYRDFLEKTLLKKPADEDMPIVESLRIERGDMESDILIEYDKSTEDAHSGGTSASHKLTEPTESYLTIEKSTDIIIGMYGLSASDIYAVYCKDSDIAEAGLSDPFCKVTMDSADGSSHVLLLSDIFTDENGTKCSYGMMEGGKVIYTLTAENAKWLTVQPIDICSRIMIASYVWNVTDLSVSGGGESVDFKIAPKDKDNTPETPKTEDFVVTKNGEEFDTERYRLFYSFLIGANAEEFALDAPVPESEPTASIKLSDSFSGKTTTYEFYDDSILRSLIVVDGESKYYCTKAYANTLIENIKRISTGEDFITNW